MLDNSPWDSIADLGGPEDFYRRDHQQIFSAIQGLSARSQPADAVTLAEYLRPGPNSRKPAGRVPRRARADTPSAANIPTTRTSFASARCSGT